AEHLHPTTPPWSGVTAMSARPSPSKSASDRNAPPWNDSSNGPPGAVHTSAARRPAVGRAAAEGAGERVLESVRVHDDLGYTRCTFDLPSNKTRVYPGSALLFTGISRAFLGPVPIWPNSLCCLSF